MKRSTTLACEAIGIDAGKAYLDISSLNGQKTLKVPNSDEGIARLVEWVGQFDNPVVGAEATGGLELSALIALHEAGITVARLNPRWVKDFSKSMGKRAKTDALDAALIAKYMQVIEPEPWQPLDEDGWTFKDLASRRRQLVNMVTMETNRSQSCKNAYISRQHLRLVTHMKNQISEIEDLLIKMIERCQTWRDKASIICSVPGIAMGTAAGNNGAKLDHGSAVKVSVRPV